MTPERRIENIFHEIEQLVAPARDLVPFFAPHTTSMSLKSLSLIHIFAHAKLHAVKPDEKAAPEDKKDRHTKEVEAESVRCV